MATLCVIPARGGSKRIPHKNIIDFCGKPLIAYSIENALGSGVFDELIVSSDDEAIIKVASKCGASVPFVRPKELSDDFSSSDIVITHVINELEKMGRDFENVCCLYATAPLLSAEILRKAYEEFQRGESIFLFSACEFSYPIQRAFWLDEQKRVNMFDESNYHKRSQDLPKAYHDAGAFYFGKKEAWLRQKILFKPYAKAFVLQPNLVCDIDTPQDLEFAKFLYQFNLQNKEKQCF